MLRHAESWDYGASVNQRYSEVAGTMAYEGGRFGNCLRITDGNTPGIVGITLAQHATWIVGFALQLTYSGTDKALYDMISPTSQTQLTLNYQNSTQRLYLTGAWGSSATTTTVFAPNVWYYVEIKITCADAGGSYALRVNEQVEISATGVDTNSGGGSLINRHRLRSGNSTISSVPRRYDDWYVCDGVDSGVTGRPNNDFLGDCRVQCIMPNGNGNSSQFDGSDGNQTDNYLLVDETTVNTADYVESADVGDKDTYPYGNLTASAGTVYGVATVPLAHKTDAGSRHLKSVMRLSTSEVDGPDINLLDQAQYYQSFYEGRPTDNAPWDIADVNALESGYKVFS